MQRIMHPFSPLPSIPTVTSSSDAKISPAILLVIVILAIIFFSGGLIHLLVRFFVKRPSIYSFSSSGRYSENAASDAIQRQLQQLFRLHDSGLDQDIIDALPVFSYKDIVGLKESSDCAVCLCEFSDQDQLRLLPVCSHAFHVNCIDMWLLSNSTCPLCRNTLVSTDYSLDFSREFPIGQSNDGGSVHSAHDKPGIMEEERVYSVRLGKLRSTIADNEEISSSNLNARRCYSMGSREYVIGDPDLMVKTRTSQNSDSIVDGDVEAKRISCSNKGESFSISKIWLWSKKTSSSDTNLISGGPFHSVLPLTNKVQTVDENI